MKIDMMIVLYCNDPKSQHILGAFKKELESDIIPAIGTKIEETVWHDPKEIKEVVINYAKKCCHINFGLEELAKEEQYETYKKMYESQGWKSV